MRKIVILVGSIALSTPALANNGHVTQVHHGANCVEFVTLEEATSTCGASNVFSNGTVSSACMANLQWYGIGISTDPTQTALTVSQLPSFIAWTSAIDTAFDETQAVFAVEDVQLGEGFSLPTAENNLLLGPSSALGFTPNGQELTCANIDASGTHSVVSVGNLNTPPAPNQ